MEEVCVTLFCSEPLTAVRSAIAETGFFFLANYCITAVAGLQTFTDIPHAVDRYSGDLAPLDLSAEFDNVSPTQQLSYDKR
jgi:hypothetical protein